MKLSDLGRFFVRKMSFEFRPRAKHDEYQVRIRAGKFVPLPVLLTVSRGSGEIGQRNLKGLANNLGLTLGALEDAEKCNLGRVCILTCLTAHLLEFAMERSVRPGEQPPWDEEMLIRLCESARMLLEDAADQCDNETLWKKREKAELDRVQGLLDKTFANCITNHPLPSSHGELEAAINHWRQFVKQYAEEK